MDRAGLAAFIEACRNAGMDLSAEELLEVVYLARLLPPHDADRRLGSKPEAVGTAAAAVPTPPAPIAAQRPDRTRGTGPVPPEVPAPHLAPAVAGPVEVLLPVPAAPSIRRASFAKALRPLKLTVASVVDLEIDISATVRRTADSHMLSVTLQPAEERRMTLSVAIDDAASGPAFTAEVRELVRAFEESGVFATVRVWRFDSDDPASRPLRVRSGGPVNAARNSRELIDPTGRCAILVFSDCVGAAWGDGRVGRMVADWAGAGPAAIIHLLPQRMWTRCRPRFVEVEWHSGQPFAASRLQQWRSREVDLLAGPTTPGLLVPVFDLTPSSFATWADLVAGGVGRWHPGVAYVADANDADVEAPAGDKPADDRPPGVARLRAVLSPEAYRLAILLSAAPLQLPVIRMMQRVMLGTDQSIYWAEILLSGCVQRLEDDEHNQPVYDFHPGIREELVGLQTRRQALALLHCVSEFIAARMDGTLDFAGLLLLDVPADGIAPADRPLAMVAIKTFTALGGAYADLATRIGRLLLLQGTQQPTQADASVHANAGPTPPDPHDRSRRAAAPPTVWQVPGRPSWFIGRDTLLNRLRDMLTSGDGDPAVLTGVEGIGRSAVAIEYANRYRDTYGLIWWIPANNPATLRHSLTELARALGMPVWTDRPQTVDAVLNALNAGQPVDTWLLVYDDADDPEQVRKYLPALDARRHAIIVTGHPDWSSTPRSLLVGPVPRAASVDLLRSAVPTLPVADAEQFATNLSDIPLALLLGAAWRQETGLDPNVYRTRHTSYADTWYGPDETDEYRAAAAAIYVAYHELRTRSLPAAQLLLLCAHLGRGPIALDLLVRHGVTETASLPAEETLANLARVRQHVREIAHLGLATLEDDHLRVHPLVQAALRKAATHEPAAATARDAARALLVRANPGRGIEGSESADQSRHALMAPHVVPAGLVEAPDPDARRTVLDQIQYHVKNDDHATGQALAVLAVRQWTQRWGPHDELVLLAEQQVAAALRQSGRLSDALRIDGRVLAMFRETLGEHHARTLVAATAYATDLRAIGRYREALEVDQETLTRLELAVHPEDSVAVRAAAFYALDLRLLGRFEPAREVDAQIHSKYVAALGNVHPQTLVAATNLVRDLTGLGRYPETLTLQRTAVAAAEPHLSPTSRELLQARHAIAVLLRRTGRHEEAAKEATLVRSELELVVAPDDERYLAACASLANALRDVGRALPEAREIMTAVLVRSQRRLNDHPVVDAYRTNLAVILRRLGAVDEARRLDEAAVASLRATLGANHPDTLSATSNLATDHAVALEWSAACSLSADVLMSSRGSPARGPDHPDTLVAAINHSLNLGAAGRTDEADTLGRDAESRLARILGPAHPYLERCRHGQRIDSDIEPVLHTL